MTVSQYLSSLRANGDVSFEDPGWLANRSQLPASYWRSYASRFASESCWYGMDDVTAQLGDLVERQPELIVSGDVAAYAVLPLKVPAVAIIYGSVEDSGDMQVDQPLVFQSWIPSRDHSAIDDR